MNGPEITNGAEYRKDKFLTELERIISNRVNVITRKGLPHYEQKVEFLNHVLQEVQSGMENTSQSSVVVDITTHIKNQENNTDFWFWRRFLNNVTTVYEQLKTDPPQVRSVKFWIVGGAKIEVSHIRNINAWDITGEFQLLISRDQFGK